MPPLWLLLNAVALFFFQEYFFLVARLLENHRELLLEGNTSLDLLSQIVQRMILGMKLHHRWSRCDEHLTEQDTLHTTEYTINITINNTTNNEIAALACPDGPSVTIFLCLTFFETNVSLSPREALAAVLQSTEQLILVCTGDNNDLFEWYTPWF